MNASPPVERRGATKEPIRYQRSALRRRLRSRLNPWLLRARMPAGSAPAALVVAGSPRSGTTWLAELICQLPGTAMLFEPLQHDQVPAARDAGLHRGSLPDPTGENDRAADAHFERMLQGQVLNAWTTSRISLLQLARLRRWVVKLVHGNLVLPRLVQHFSVRRPVLLLRHPCAVVASQRKLASAHCWEPEWFDPFLDRYPEFAALVRGAQHVEQRLAVSWAVQQFTPLASEQADRLQVVAYEHLVRRGKAELERILAGWNESLPAGAERRFAVASTTTQRDSHLLRQGDPLAAWQRQLRDVEAQRVLDVARAFGLDFYNEELEPTSPLRVSR